MATAAVSSSDIDDLTNRFEKWLNVKLGTADEELMFANYIISIVSDEDSTEDDKAESIKPLLQELNQNDLFDEEKVCTEIIETWNQMKSEESSSGKPKADKSNEENPTDTILSMINKHKTQVDTKKTNTSNLGKDCEYAADYAYGDRPGEDSDEENESNTISDVLENTNSKDAKDKERLNREKIAEVHQKQKEQAKKALIEQKEKEVEKKKQKQAKAAKVERKR